MSMPYANRTRVLQCATNRSAREVRVNYKPTTTVRIAPDLKALANEVFHQMGITMSVAINAFLTNVVRTGRLPFELDSNQPHADGSGLKSSVKPAKNATLNRAFKARKDEFYTQYEDIESELIHYPEQFAGRRVLCNCDDPFESAFFRYLLLHFDELGLASLRSTCYRTSPIAGGGYGLETNERAYTALVTKVPHDDLLLPDGSLDLETVFELEGNSIDWLEGDGDFRSDECISFLKESDIVVTNPPFSLFREFVSQLVEHEKDFLILGNMNASTYREVFPLFRDNKVWYGVSIRSGDRKFHVPDSYPLGAANCGVDDSGRRFIRVKGVRWFTNLDNSRRREQLNLEKKFNPRDYPYFDNYDAIEVGRTLDIPDDFDGLMGVPITFLDRYNPVQFEIVMLANGNARTNVPQATLDRVGYKPNQEDKGGVGLLGGKRSYARILIQRVDR